jgi:hypothetical protein
MAGEDYFDVVDKNSTDTSRRIQETMGAPFSRPPSQYGPPNYKEIVSPPKPDLAFSNAGVKQREGVPEKPVETPPGYPTRPEARFGSSEPLGPVYTGEGEGVPEKPAGGPPWTKEGNKYTLEGGQGTLTVSDERVPPGGYKASEVGDISQLYGGRDVNLSPGGAGAKGVEQEWRAGVQKREEQALREREQRKGPEAPGEFDIGKYKRTMQEIWPSGNVPAKMKIALLGEMYKEHETKQRSYDAYQQHLMQYGPGSPSMIQAKSAENYHEVLAKAIASKNPAEIAHIAAQTAHLFAQAKSEPERMKLWQSQRKALEALAKYRDLAPMVKMMDKEMDKADTPREKQVALQHMKDFMKAIQQQGGFEDLTQGEE